MHGRSTNSANGQPQPGDDDLDMFRRDLLRWLSTATLAGVGPACTAPLTAPLAPSTQKPSGQQLRSLPARKVRAICFDLFTLFDPRSVVEVVREVVPNRSPEFAEAWRNRQFQYAFLRAAGANYQDFERVTEAALAYTEAAHGLSLTFAARRRLLDAYSELEPWPDTRASLLAFREAGLRLAPLANYSPSMLERLLDHASLRENFETLLSTDLVRTFKPDPRAYALGVERLGLAKDEIVFAAFGGWDAAGAKWFGYPTFWVNRLAQTAERLEPGPDASGPTLAELAQFVASRG
jgi:2-haloacid dehalogenase